MLSTLYLYMRPMHGFAIGRDRLHGLAQKAIRLTYTVSFTFLVVHSCETGFACDSLQGYSTCLMMMPRGHHNNPFSPRNRRQQRRGGAALRQEAQADLDGPMPMAQLAGEVSERTEAQPPQQQGTAGPKVDPDAADVEGASGTAGEHMSIRFQ